MLSEKDINRIDNLIGVQCKIAGKVHGKGLLKIDGTVEGDIVWEDNIILDSSSLCKGNVCCKNAIINGTVEGDIICKDTLVIQSSGKITGDISTVKLVINEGGKFSGRCSMMPKI
ncbi:polymer-forming cytoskeletal protein [Clostridium bovifaecis]|uniref:Polymer-forming cytoskeletal protein n=1 Tax=Clostridium bovifaecis TaxID=2184719 RepID=A0A6I6EQB1_9CLOT|nr:polymer-forming cytoskeletal protein [Clostridium bovifaecis]